MVKRALHPAGPRQPDQLGRVELARRTADPERRDQLRRRDQRVHRQGREPAGRADDDARGVRRDRTAPGPCAVHGRRPRLDRDAGRRDLRQRWRPAAVERGPVREHGTEVRARALHGGGVAGAERAAGEEEKEAQAQEAQGQVEAEEGGWHRGRERRSRAQASEVRHAPRRQVRAPRRQAVCRTTPASRRSSASTTLPTPRRRRPSRASRSRIRRCPGRARRCRTRSRSQTPARCPT